MFWCVFYNRDFWGVGYYSGYCAGGCFSVTFGGDWGWISFSVGELWCVQRFFDWVSSLSLCLFGFVEVSVSSDFFFLWFVIGKGTCRTTLDSIFGGVYPFVVSGETFAIAFVAVFTADTSVDSFAVVVFVVDFCFLMTWLHPSLGLFWWSPDSRAGLVVGLVFFFLLCWYCRCSCYYWWVSSVGRIWPGCSAACRTSRLDACPPRPPSSAGPCRSGYEGWPGSPHCKGKHW